jgi:tRNA (guanosine-2'-O-)-methyltransferase
MISEKRLAKIKELVRRRQRDMTLILENVHDPHNLGAIIRTCEAVGMKEVFILYTVETTNEEWYVGRNAASGVKKWLDLHFYTELDACVNHVKEKYKTIATTHLYKPTTSAYDYDYTAPFALVFGNEHAGVTEEMYAVSNQNIAIPIMGMAESLNVSASASVILFEAMRQRIHSGQYDRPFDVHHADMRKDFTEYVYQSRPRVYDADMSILEKHVEEFGSDEYEF